MNKQFIVDGLGWGFLLWLIGYLLGIGLFMTVPDLIGYILTPIGIGLILWVLIKKIKSADLRYYLAIAGIWTVIAIVFDYLFIVKAFNSDDYYKWDVYLYYLLTLGLPIVVGWLRVSGRNKKAKK